MKLNDNTRRIVRERVMNRVFKARNDALQGDLQAFLRMMREYAFANVEERQHFNALPRSFFPTLNSLVISNAEEPFGPNIVLRMITEIRVPQWLFMTRTLSVPVEEYEAAAALSARQRQLDTEQAAYASKLSTAISRFTTLQELRTGWPEIQFATDDFQAPENEEVLQSTLIEELNARGELS